MERMENTNKKQYKAEFIEMYGMRAWKERNRERRGNDGFDFEIKKKRSHNDYSRVSGKRFCREALLEF